MAVGDAHVFPGFLTPVLTQLSFQSHRLLFSHASAEVRGENTPERKVASTGDRTHNHQVTSPTCSPLSHLGRAIATEGQRACHQFCNRNTVLKGSCHPWSPFNNFSDIYCLSNKFWKHFVGEESVSYQSFLFLSQCFLISILCLTHYDLFTTQF